MGIVAKTLLALGIGVITAAVVMVAGSFLFFEIAMLAGANNMNGGLAMGVANDIAPLIGLAGLGLGLWLGYRVVRTMQDRTALVGAGVVLSVIAAVSYWIWLWYLEAF
jgi:predicted membrane-bound spermidine synthase